MATNYRQLQQEAEHYRQAARSGLAEIDRIKRQNAALRGVITKLRKQALAAKEER